MAAYVDHRFNGGFILDEGRLRKIVELINNRYSPELLSFTVYRGDSYSYTTHEVDHVVNEDNDGWRVISRIDISINTDDVDLKLSFHEYDFSIRITGENRDTVFLLFSDLKEYINSEVLSHKNDNSFIMSLIPPFIIIIPFIIFLSYYIYGNHSSKDVALASSDIAVKLNYLISSGRDKEKAGPITYMFIASILPILLLTLKMSDIIKFIKPTNQFLFGKNIEKFRKRKKLVSNVFWVVIVGALVGLATGIITWIITK